MMPISLREALAAFRRTPLLNALGVITIAFSLFAFGLFSLVAVNIRRALEQVEERVEIRAFLTDSASMEAAGLAMGDIGNMPEVLNVSYVSREQALQRARSELGEFSDVFEEGVLPPSIDIKLRPGFRNPATVRTVASRLKVYDFVDDIRYGEEWVEKLYKLRNISAAVGTGLGLTFAIVAVIIIGSTIRMVVLARTKEIEIMRLVGATNSFIRRPFLIEGFIDGVLGGLLALLLIAVTDKLVNTYIINTVFFEPTLAIGGILGGAIIGLLGSAFAVGRHLRGV
jgi:cell division transport system permease protein